MRMNVLLVFLNPAIITSVLVFSIPLVAIIGGYYVKLRRMELEKGGVSEKDRKNIDFLLQENERLRQRVENLEQIITSIEPDLLSLRPLQKENDLQKQVEELARKLRNE
ncbi:Phage shock protein B [Raineya orbicola]|jgi:uncharacterized protein YlxW (UPF0749 family)|uniref:Phage shock protein B n=2 Tax=Raineya orbicola TaxID=2016530 RepID=A0A2N3ID43_9BACT|nr:Phage shock protein B [Raineya orbicola]